MSLPRIPLTVACALAALLAQSCVEYVPTASYPPPPPAPPAEPQQVYASQPYYAPQAPAQPQAAPAETPLDSLVAPIALYPDPLLALLLPASTFPDQVQAASGYLVQYGSLRFSGGRVWDGSIMGLSHYPVVVEWMAQNLPWTEALGNAFAANPSGVMEAVQRVRSRALASGRLRPTPQQRVLTENGEIEIIPAQDGTIFVPSYDAEALVASDPYYGGAAFEDFGDAYPCGEWLTFSFDWDRGSVWSGGGATWLANGAWRRETPKVATVGAGQTWRAPKVPPAPVQRLVVPRSGPVPVGRSGGSRAPVAGPGTRAPQLAPAPVTPQPRPRIGGGTTPAPSPNAPLPVYRTATPGAQSPGPAAGEPGATAPRRAVTAPAAPAEKSKAKAEPAAEQRNRVEAK